MVRSFSSTAVAVLSLSGFAHAFVIKKQNDTTRSLRAPAALVRRDEDPTSFAWVHQYAVIGDSFTAGIGSGVQLSDVWHPDQDWWCSRYDQSYPMLVNNVLGPSVDKFQVCLVLVEHLL